MPRFFLCATNPFESEWIQKIYDWYCHGVAVKEIQSRLSRQGVMTRRGNAQWSLGSIQLILRNPVYAGHFDYTDKMIGETVRIQTPAIIDPHLFQIAQDKRKATREHKHQVTPSKHFHLLRGVHQHWQDGPTCLEHDQGCSSADQRPMPCAKRTCRSRSEST